MADRQVVIIGSGPAGLTAALYTARANLKPLLIEGLEAGGQLMLTTMVENWPGFRDGIMGPDLMVEMREQARRFGTEILEGNVTRTDLKRRPFTITMADGPAITTESLIIATGASARWLDIGSDRRLSGHGVSTCATCDGYFFRGKPIAVVGGGDSAMEEATFLTRFARSVTLIHRREEFRASKIMLERARANEKIKFLTNTQVTAIEGDPKVSGVRLRNAVTGEESELGVTGVFVAIGHNPRSDLVRGQVDLDPEGYVLVKGRTTSTSVDGVFACGDLVDHTYRQAVTAAGTGCSASIDAERWLAETASATTDDSTDLIGAQL